MSAPSIDVAEFWASTDRASGCWLWTGRVNGDGYAQVKYGDRWISVHRVAFTLAHRALLPGETVDHLCHGWATESGHCRGGRACPHRRCINPEHLDACSPEENVRRGHAARRAARAAS